MPNPADEIRNRCAKLFREWDKIVPDGLGGVDPRTLRRWFNKAQDPDVDSAKAVAGWVWARVQQPVAGQALRSTLDRVADKLHLAVPAIAWTSHIEFVEFFRCLAEEEKFILAAEVHVDGQPLARGPVHPRQFLGIRATTPAPAFFYLFWVTPLGVVQPIFPWRPVLDKQGLLLRFDFDPALDVARREVLLPPADSPTAWDFDQAAGLETLAVCVRREVLPTEARKALLHNFRAIAGADASPLPNGPVTEKLLRAKGGAPNKIGFRPRPADPIAARHGAIAAALGDYLDVGACISFRNDGAGA